MTPLHRMSVPVRQGGHAPGSPVDMRQQHIQDMRDRMNRRAVVLRGQRRIGFACMALSALTMLYMIGQLLRLVLS